MKTLNLCSLLAAVLIAPVFGAGPWHTDFDAAKKLAAKEKKDLLIDFTGSDWCGWCIKLKKEVFDHDAFKKGVSDHFVLVELDFPRDKSKLSEETQTQNDKLKNQFGIRGFPTIYLCDAKGRPYARTGYRAGGPEEYVKHLDELRAKRSERDQTLAGKGKKEAIKATKLVPAKKKGPEPKKPMASKEAPKAAVKPVAGKPMKPAAPARRVSEKHSKIANLSKVSEDQLKKALDEEKRKLAQSRDAHEQTGKDWQKAQAALKDLRDKAKAVEQELAKLKRAIATTEKKASALETQHEATHASEATSKKAMENLEKELQRRALIAQLEKEAAELQRKAEALRKRAEELKR